MKKISIDQLRQLGVPGGTAIFTPLNGQYVDGEVRPTGLLVRADAHYLHISLDGIEKLAYTHAMIEYVSGFVLLHYFTKE